MIQRGIHDSNAQASTQFTNQRRASSNPCGASEKAKQTAIEFSRNVAFGSRETRIHGETQSHLALALDAPLRFAIRLGGRHTSLYSFNAKQHIAPSLGGDFPGARG
ncbi:hypothetical protein NOC27_1414 [Nitrosococcus oceani AFC27]|nr:hypothetical protein NOC27_1414 [Nitrosococcus oceani AFC27]